MQNSSEEEHQKCLVHYSLNYAEQLGRTEELKKCLVHVLVTSEETPDMFSHCFGVF